MAITGGGSAFDTGAVLTIAHVTVSGSTTAVSVGESLKYAGTWTQSSGTVTVASGDTLTFSGTGNSFAGTLTGAGKVAFAKGTDTLNGTSLTAAGFTIDGATVTAEGIITNPGAITVAAPNPPVGATGVAQSLIIAAAGATLVGAGSVLMSNSVNNEITGATGGATLTNVDNTISGAGAIGGGQMTLVNQVSGMIDANHATALTLDTGGATIANAGLIEATGSGGLTILSAVNNTGVLSAAHGNLTVKAAVSGAGQAMVNGATLDFTSAFDENVTFGGTTGVLMLGQSQAYGGTVSGFSKSGKTSFDLADITFVGANEATYSGTKTGGVLTVTDGTHTAHINLMGNYLSSTWVASSDGHGGTIVIDPKAKGAGGAAPPQFPAPQFIAAMAGLGGEAGGAIHVRETWPGREPLLAGPRTLTA